MCHCSGMVKNLGLGHVGIGKATKDVEDRMGLCFRKAIWAGNGAGKSVGTREAMWQAREGEAALAMWGEKEESRRTHVGTADGGERGEQCRASL